MAVRFTELDPSRWEIWIPDFKGERELASTKPDEAFSMELRFLTKNERARHERLAQQIVRGKMSDGEADRYMSDLFDSHVRNVRNYYDGDKEITNGKELLTHLMENGESDLAYEITAALAKRSALEDGLAKKLRSGSAIDSSRQNHNEDGAAVDAIPVLPQTTQATEMATYVYQTESNENNEDVTETQKASSTNGPLG